MGFNSGFKGLICSQLASFIPCSVAPCHNGVTFLEATNGRDGLQPWRIADCAAFARAVLAALP